MNVLVQEVPGISLGEYRDISVNNLGGMELLRDRLSKKPRTDYVGLAPVSSSVNGTGWRGRGRGAGEWILS